MTHAMKHYTIPTVLLLAMLQALPQMARAEAGNPRVNQLGYIPTGLKTATYKTETTAPQTWALYKDGMPIAQGNTSVGSRDASSGDVVQQIDFSTVTTTGSGFTLKVGADSSYPFTISGAVFRAPLYDALKYFYHNRSGIAIDLAFTGGGNTSYAPDRQWARAAGHAGTGVNRGDLRVPCWEGTCTYTLDVPRGWYDAGDHGKYVVNAGISAWTLMNLYERGLYLGTTTRVADGMLNIPESANGVPDVLDEVRWALEFMLAMQVPQGRAKSGMVHHKVHDTSWTGLPLAPEQDTQPRALVPPSTAATLNLAAVAAQAARIWRPLDPDFASRCLRAARLAWHAALSHPADLYRGGYDTGGGAYDDDKVDDEFYWAAAELWLTTGEERYLSTLDAHTLTHKDLSWSHTELAGEASLATVAKPGSEAQRRAAQQHVIAIADTYLDIQRTSGYASPLAPYEYEWGSNGAVTNRLVLVGLAYHFGKDRKFADGVVRGMDYLFGRNTFSTSFVTGVGTVAARYPHHRFWAGALDARFPLAPPGALTGGPNPGLQDPLAASSLASCVAYPANCWMDHIDAYSVNEVAINWNAPLAWVLDFMNGLDGP